MKVYTDHNVVIALHRQDQRAEENEAILLLKAWWDAGRITLFVSAVHDRESAPPEQYRTAQAAMLALFPRLQFADDHLLEGYNTSGVPARQGFISTPRTEDDSVARRLREISLDRLDAHHVMLAIKRGCAAFVTCDEVTILKYRTQVEAEFPISLMLPSEFIQRHPDTVDPRGPKASGR